jgi:hypothetical protein
MKGELQEVTQSLQLGTSISARRDKQCLSACWEREAEQPIAAERRESSIHLCGSGSRIFI